MTTITAVFENGVFRPLQPVEGFESGAQVELSVDMPRNAFEKLKSHFGSIPREEIELIETAIEEACEVVDPDEWK